MIVSLAGTRAFVTAGGAGMGRATALAMHAAGAEVFTCDIDATGLDTLPDDVVMVSTRGGAGHVRDRDVDALRRRPGRRLPTWSCSCAAITAGTSPGRSSGSMDTPRRCIRVCEPAEVAHHGWAISVDGRGRLRVGSFVGVAARRVASYRSRRSCAMI